MVERIFLGWNQPLLGLASEWLLQRENSLETTLVLVPSAQSARQLKHRMARKAGAILSPKFSTPGALMRTEHPDIAADWLETLGWQEILEKEAPRQTLETLFSESAHTEGDWAGGIAGEMVALRRSLQDNGLGLRDVARRLSATPESERWDCLANLERLLENWLSKQGYKSRTSVLRTGITLPDGIDTIVLAGISELPPMIARVIEESSLPITSLIAAPQSLSDLFTDIGTPSEAWSEQALDWPEQNGSVEVAIDPKQQARCARSRAASQKTPVQELAIGTADTQSGDIIAHEFTTAGWTSHHPASTLPTSSLRRWLHSWSTWLNQPDLASMMDLLSMPQTASLIEADCAEIADLLASLRDQWMVIHPENLRHQLKHRGHPRIKAEAASVIRACDRLEKWRKLSLEGKTTQAMRHLLGAIESADDDQFEILDWIDQAADQMDKPGRSMSYWIKLMLADLPRPQSKPPAGRVLDIQGWLELMFQPGSHLIVCGLNEGKVPASNSDDPWLGESGRTLLGLPSDKQRAARDAFLFQSLVHSRMESGGRVDLLCTRTNEKGEPQLPSRLLLAARPEQTAARIEKLFCELEPADAKLRWETEDASRWRVPAAEAPEVLSATSFGDYLACPFRYYLKHVHRMRSIEPERIEWNARDFGTIIHNTLESWGRDETARQLCKADEISDWLNESLDQQVESTFNQRIPLAVRIQLDTMRQRLEWFAQAQEELATEGWIVDEVEQKFPIPIGTTGISAKIDRIDRHRETGQMRIIDYKTGGKTDSAASSHRTKQNARSRLPEHITEQDPPLYTRRDAKKEIAYLWKDLQLPLYALAVHHRYQVLATPCYFKLGETRNDVQLQAWDDFDEVDLHAAEACAQWVCERIAAKRFWPISQKVAYDDYELLWCTHNNDELVSKPE